MEILFLFLGIAIGAYVSWLWSKLQSTHLQSDKVNRLQELLLNEKEKYFKLQALFEAQKEQFVNIEKHLKESFRLIASQAVQENNQSFVNLAEKTLEKYTQKATSDMQLGNEKLENIIKPLDNSLQRHEALIKELEAHNHQTFGNLKNHIEELIKKQTSLEKETNALVSALKSPKVRGKWGEIGLKRLVEFAGMNEFCDFSEQKSVTDEDKNLLRPDMVVYLPESRKVVIDSKMPLLAYLNAIETSDEKLREELLIMHSAALRKHVKDLSTKNYWQQFDDSVDFVVLYIEVESAFGTALAYDKELVLDAIKNKILIATPTTLIGLLQTISYSWRQHKATENAIEIWKQAKIVYQRLTLFSEHLQKMGNQLNMLVKTYNQTIGSWQGRAIPALKKMNELGIAPLKTDSISLQSIDSIAKDVD